MGSVIPGCRLLWLCSRPPFCVCAFFQVKITWSGANNAVIRPLSGKKNSALALYSLLPKDTLASCHTSYEFSSYLQYRLEIFTFKVEVSRMGVLGASTHRFLQSMMSPGPNSRGPGGHKYDWLCWHIYSIKLCMSTWSMSDDEAEQGSFN